MNELLSLIAEASGDPPTWVIVLIPVAFLVVFPAFWCFVIGILSYVGGWRRLASRYQAQEEPNGGTYHGLQGMVGLVSYRGTLDATTTEKGFFLRPNLLFRFGHPLLFIPWSECYEVRRRKIFWLEQVRFTVGNPTLGSLSLPVRVFEETAGRSLLEGS